MNITMISSLNTYTKNMKMQMKWKQRKSSGDYTSKGNSENLTATERLLRDQREKAAELMKQNTSSVSKQQIDMKIRSGKRLSTAEMQYLKENDPQTYEKAKQIELERQAYERELKQCKTKEEVQRVKFSHAAASLATVKETDTNPNIPEGAKLAIITQELAKTNALGDAERAFLQSGEYRSLPSENEQIKAEKDLKKAEEAEKGIDDKTNDTPEEVADSVNEEAAAETVEENADIQEKAPSEAEIKAAKEVISGKKITRMEAEVTPEARKVRRARAQAAYARTAYTGEASGSVDIKIT